MFSQFVGGRGEYSWVMGFAYLVADKEKKREKKKDAWLYHKQCRRRFSEWDAQKRREKKAEKEEFVPMLGPIEHNKF